MKLKFAKDAGLDEPDIEFLDGGYQVCGEGLDCERHEKQVARRNASGET
jgi:hypothetical protein